MWRALSARPWWEEKWWEGHFEGTSAADKFAQAVAAANAGGDSSDSDSGKAVQVVRVRS